MPPEFASEAEPPPIGSLEELRAEIATSLRLAVVHADHGANYADMGADAFLKASIGCLVSYVRHAYDVLLDLEGKKGKRP